MLAQKKKKWTSKDCVSAKNLKKVSTCHSRNIRRGKMWPVPLTWNVTQLPETGEDGMVRKHQHLCSGTTQQVSIAWCFLISYTGFHWCCCCILTKMCREISSSTTTLQSTFAVKVQIQITKEASCEIKKSLHGTILRERSFLSSLVKPLVIQTPLEQFITERDSIHIV